MRGTPTPPFFNGWKEVFAHKRTWAIIVALLVQALGPVLHLVLDDPNVVYLTGHLPYLLAGLWTALVIGQAYEDKVTRGSSSALAVLRAPSKGGGWRYALLALIRNEKFVATVLGTVLAVVALAVPRWAGLPELEESFTRLAELVVILAGSLTVTFAYSAAHDEHGAGPEPPPIPLASAPISDPEVEPED